MQGESGIIWKHPFDDVGKFFDGQGGFVCALVPMTSIWPEAKRRAMVHGLCREFYVAAVEGNLFVDRHTAGLSKRSFVCQIRY